MMLWELYLGVVVIITVCWMLGGQFGSAWRKYGVMVATVGLASYLIANGEAWWIFIPIVPFCAALFLGYGEKSWFMKLLKNEELVRIADSVVLLIPLVIMAYLSSRPKINYAIQTIALAGAFQTRLGGIRIGGKDLLWDDLLRGLAVGIALVCAV